MKTFSLFLSLSTIIFSLACGGGGGGANVTPVAGGLPTEFVDGRSAADLDVLKDEVLNNSPFKNDPVTPVDSTNRDQLGSDTMQAIQTSFGAAFTPGLAKPFFRKAREATTNNNLDETVSGPEGGSARVKGYYRWDSGANGAYPWDYLYNFDITYTGYKILGSTFYGDIKYAGSMTSAKAGDFEYKLTMRGALSMSNNGGAYYNYTYDLDYYFLMKDYTIQKYSYRYKVNGEEWLLEWENDGSGGGSGGVVAPNTPTNLTASLDQTNKISLTWDAVSGADGYYLYRDDVNGNYATASRVTYTQGTSYNDSDVQAGLGYDYWVTASNSGGQGTESSRTTGQTKVTSTEVNDGVWFLSEEEHGYLGYLRAHGDWAFFYVGAVSKAFRLENNVWSVSNELGDLGHNVTLNNGILLRSSGSNLLVNEYEVNGWGEAFNFPQTYYGQIFGNRVLISGNIYHKVNDEWIIDTFIPSFPPSNYGIINLRGDFLYKLDWGPDNLWPIFTYQRKNDIWEMISTKHIFHDDGNPSFDTNESWVIFTSGNSTLRVSNWRDESWGWDRYSEFAIYPKVTYRENNYSLEGNRLAIGFAPGAESEGRVPGTDIYEFDGSNWVLKFFIKNEGTGEGRVTLSNKFIFISSGNSYAESDRKGYAIYQLDKLTPVTNPTTLPRYLPAPVNFSATDGTSNSISLSWDAVTGADTYNIYRSENPIVLADQTNLLLSGITGTTYDDTAAGTKTYYYWVSVLNSVGESSLSAVDSGYVSGATGPMTPTIPDSPTNFNITEDRTLTWTDKTNPTFYYTIYSSKTNDSSEATVLASALLLKSYQDQLEYRKDTSYYYWVTATNSVGESPFGASVFSSASAPTLPAQPQNLTATQGTYEDKITLTWSAVTDISSYDIYKSIDLSFSTNTVTRVSPSSSVATITHYDTSVDAGVTYFYKVTAYNGSVSSAFSETVSGYVKSISTPAIPGQPQNLTATQGTHEDKVTLTWSAVTGSSNYKIYRSLDSSFSTNIVTNIPTISSGASTNTITYDDAIAVVPLTTYYYRVIASNSFGSSIASNIVTGYSSSSSTSLVAPSFISASDAISADIITIAWSSVASATGYTLYRSAQNDSSQASVIATNLTSTSYDDSTAGTGSFYYWVKSLGASSVSIFSSSDIGSLKTD